MTAYSPWPIDFEGDAKRRKAEGDAEALRDILAESVASDVRDLRLALAEIVVETRGHRVYGGGCACAGGGCDGHIPETTKIARAALGLTELPDKPRFPLPFDDSRRRNAEAASPTRGSES